MMAAITFTTSTPFLLTVDGALNSAGEVVADLTAPPAGSALLPENNLSDVDSAPEALTNLGGTATGIDVFTAANTPAAQAAIGAGTAGSAVFIAESINDVQTAIGATSVGAAVLTAADAAAVYTALGLGDYADDAAAATGGVAVGFAYHTAGALRTRMA